MENRRNLRLHLSYIGPPMKNKEHVFSKSLRESDLVPPHKGFIGKPNPELKNLRSNF